MVIEDIAFFALYLFVLFATRDSNKEKYEIYFKAVAAVSLILGILRALFFIATYSREYANKKSSGNSAFQFIGWDRIESAPLIQSLLSALIAFFSYKIFSK
jgi:hypothetical protein